MGASVSTNVAKTVTKISTKISNNQQNIARVETNQTNNFVVKGLKCSGDLVIDGVTQTNEAQVNLTQAALGMTDVSVQSQMTAQLKQSAEAANHKLNLLQIAVATSITDTVQESATEIVNNITNSCGGKLSQTNTQSFIDNQVKGDCIFRNINQTNKVDATLDCVQKAVSSSTAITKAQTMIDQASKASNTGIDPTTLFVVVGVVFVAFIIGSAYAVPKILETTAGKALTVAVPIALVVAAVVLLMTAKQDVVRMRRSAFSTMCSSVGTGSTQNKQYTNADDAVLACKNDTVCKAVEFNKGTTKMWNSGDFRNCKPASTVNSGVEEACNKCNKAIPCNGEKDCPGCYCDVKTVWEYDDFDEWNIKQGPNDSCGKKWCKNENECVDGETPSHENSGECGKPVCPSNKNCTREEDYVPVNCCKCKNYTRPKHCFVEDDRIACQVCNAGMTTHLKKGQSSSSVQAIAIKSHETKTSQAHYVIGSACIVGAIVVAVVGMKHNAK